jgi:hypothetical protein
MVEDSVTIEHHLPSSLHVAPRFLDLEDVVEYLAAVLSPYLLSSRR